MATSKTLTPTNVTIQIPEFTDQPDQRVNSNCIDKEADAINALNGKIANYITVKTKQKTNVSIPVGESGSTIDVTETGYTFLGVVGYAFYGVTKCMLSRAFVESPNVLSYNVYNDSDSAQTATYIMFRCLYVKS